MPECSGEASDAPLELLVEPHPAAANSIVPSALLVLDLTLEFFLGIMKPIDEAAHIRWHRTFLC
jgi:hypothetical protein